MPGATIVAGADTNAERLAEFAARGAVPATYADYREMLVKEHLDIVSVCTPTRAPARSDRGDRGHRRASGVFLEKPVEQPCARSTR